MNARKQRKAIRAQLSKMRVAARAKVAQLPAVKAARRRRWFRRSLLIALVLLLLFIRCDCGPTPALEQPKGEVAKVADAGVARAPQKKKPQKDKVGQNPRRDWETGSQLGPAWLDEFRLQVSARSPRLASCFTGTDRPGALRWNVALNPETGAVSDQILEPLGATDLSETQQACLRTALASPKYRITAEDRLSVPSRVSLMLEF